MAGSGRFPMVQRFPALPASISRCVPRCVAQPGLPAGARGTSPTPDGPAGTARPHDLHDPATDVQQMADIAADVTDADVFDADARVVAPQAGAEVPGSAGIART